MTSNEERREAAKRKLEQRLEAEQQQVRRRRLMLGSAAGVVVLVAAAVGGFFIYRAWDDSRRVICTYNEAADPFETLPDALPANVPDESKKQMQELLDMYKQGEKQQRTSPTPQNDPLKEGTVQVTFDTSVGKIATTLNRADGPCNVNGVISLAQDGYYDDVPCHGITITKDAGAILCGDPTGTAGTSGGWAGGNPGWTMPDEVPTNLKPVGEPSPLDPSQQSVVYPRGTVAVFNVNTPGNPMQMQQPVANTGAGSLYFFLKDSPLLPNYTVIGSVDEGSLGVLDKITENGIAPAPGTYTPKPGEELQSGVPKTEVVVTGVGVRED
ncbi:peptidylprolyl isomerase [Gordonia alkaliphila]|uniref:Peptidylprolyl isomerase n=1 Tax=Gordonia alkaliphila TaxID=1053547 RepID=A0ABP8YXQ6_9ACTN|nr:peptidylprolyl isomerase [Gordonia alkaliphila]MCK0440539.1 peptidylprolyl isomerase [Gordonia alkaliphila]